MTTWPGQPGVPDGPWAMTVLGPIPVGRLGLTLAHEHLLIRVPQFPPFEEASLRALQEAPVALENLGWIRQYWSRNYDNLVLDDEALATAEISRFVIAGGSSIIDLTLDGIGRDPLSLARISRNAGVNVVMGCGAYVAVSHPAWVRDASAETMAEHISGEFEHGAGNTGVRPGIIGEIGCSWPLDAVEARVVAAAALAQSRTGMSISIHPGRNPAAPAEIIGILEANGADLGRVIIGHIERTVPTPDGLRAIVSRGLSVAFDCFGLETSYYPVPGVTDVVMPSDAQRLDLIRGLIDAGYGERVLVSHDVCTKHRLARYGGHGYDHLVSNVMPWMRQRGFSQAEIEMLFVRNPASLLAIAAKPASVEPLVAEDTQ